jgi:preprotein translocase subunit SecD
MNKYPAWLNVLVLVILVTGILLALPNLYGSAPAIQLADRLGEPVTETQLGEFVNTLGAEGVEPEAAYLRDDRAVLRFGSPEEQTTAGERLRDRYGRNLNIALTLAPKLPTWVRGLGLNPMSLGLDLRGGVYVLLEVDMASAIQKRLESYQQDFDDRLRQARIRHRVDLDGNIIMVRVAESADYDAARDIVRDADSEVLIDDGDDDKSFRVRMSETQVRARQDFAIEQNITTLRNRVDELGILTATATVEFRLVDQSGNQPGSRRYPGRGAEPAQVLKREVIASGDEIVNASAGFSAEGQPAVNITLDAAGGERMLATTRDNLNKPMSTVFIEWREEEITRGGNTETRRVKSEEIINTATIRGVFKNNFQITGLNPIEASDLAKLLRAGALAAPVYKVDDRTIGPTLGQDNIDRGFRAIQIGFLAVIVFMVVYYRVFGLIANVALFSNLIFIVAVLSLLGASLTLPGIAGIVLTVGMAVDANVLIFERIREELAAGSSPQQAIHSGYDKALSSIADANITTLIAAIVLLGFGTGPIKGFAITLMIGILTSMFTAIVGTRTIVNLAYGGRKLESVPV